MLTRKNPKKKEWGGKKSTKWGALVDTFKGNNSSENEDKGQQKS